MKREEKTSFMRKTRDQREGCSFNRNHQDKEADRSESNSSHLTGLLCFKWEIKGHRMRHRMRRETLTVTDVSSVLVLC